MSLVSVIIPTYNSESFINEALNSIFSQTYQNIEVIVVDDGSTDSTIDLVRAFAGKVKLITQKNSGRGAARNNGVSHAEGEYIAFLDHDDQLLNNSVAERVAFLESKHSVGLVFTDAVEFDDTGDLRLFLDQFLWIDLSKCNFCQLFIGCFPLMSTVMIRAELIKAAGGFNTTINYGDDLELFLRLSLVSNFGMIPKPLTRRRIHPTQGVSSTFDRWDSRVRIYGGFTPSAGSMTTLQLHALKAALKHAYFKLGECYWERDDFSTARRMFLASISIAPHFLRAFSYAVLCMTPTAIKFLRKHKDSK